MKTVTASIVAFHLLSSNKVYTKVINEERKNPMIFRFEPRIWIEVWTYYFILNRRSVGFSFKGELHSNS